MYVPFEELAPEARLWIYQSDRKFTSSESHELENSLASFINEWTAHGNNLQGSFKIVYDQFIIIAVDENFNQASGCSIDASFKFIKAIEQSHQMNLNDRSKVAFIIEDEIVLEDFKATRDKVKSKEISSSTKTFNNHITSKKEWEDFWVTPVEDSWLKKYL